VADIIVEHALSDARLAELGVENWATWRKEVSTFEWDFDEVETAYILEGEAVITPDKGGEPVSFGADDLVAFPEGLSCTWDVRKPLFKHYRLG
jgi:uncharacterized cupin superfamily protein